MAEAVSPVVRGRRLAAALRSLRLSSGRTLEEVAVHLECSTAKISRIENGVVSVRIQDARELLALYGVRGAEREGLLELVRQAKGRSWWHAYADLMAEGFDRVIGFEEEAVAIRMLEARLVPGLVQTEQYARALMSSRRDVPPGTVERLVRLRMERQAVLRRRDGAAGFELLLDEAALRRRVGPPELMRDQYLRLLDEARSGRLALRVLPLDAEPHQAPGFSFTVFGFADPADPPVVFEELLEGTGFHESVETVGRYVFAFDHARSRALDAEASLGFVTGLAGQCG
jgi:transcriptional regulator with XRE-family HTH domain